MSSAPAPGALRGYLFLIYLCLGSLFALFGLRQFFITPAASSLANVLWFAIAVAPMLVLIPGLLRPLGPKARLTFFLASMVGMLYFVHGVWLAASPDLRTLGLWQTGFALVLTALGSLATRAAPVHAPANPAADPEPRSGPDPEPDQ
ncbi:MAG: DUF2069 domain-containing protein [Pseudomonadales bacterium]